MIAGNRYQSQGIAVYHGKVYGMLEISTFFETALFISVPF
jgi:hypothetical protein